MTPRTTVLAARRPRCRYCRRLLEAKFGRPPKVCSRKACQRAAARDRQQRRRARIA